MEKWMERMEGKKERMDGKKERIGHRMEFSQIHQLINFVLKNYFLLIFSIFLYNR